MAKENVRKLHAVLRELDTVMLTTIDSRYQLVSRPMAVRVDQLDGLLRFFAPTDSRVIANIIARASVNVSYASASASVSVAGLANFTKDPHRIARYWHSGLDPWIPGGRAAAALIEVTIFEGRCWTSTESQRIPAQLAM
ncbi:pyridoxamine 5'-phosphate oxidase family protein [Nocardia sp. XZ_19_369]|uniref:pyridoxamine 5'-phosphate oxidase family protein n=1 Tax=Nocardia sp. XZ_19_369 TaxID=2769487 RepID=UPI00188E5745|nr:pyridoxamine 5'-phosphate oxidase family protein [Nocardia sp. XZ_19_369]